MKKRSLYLQEAVTKLGVHTGYFGVFSLLSWQELQYKTGTPGDGDKCQKKVSAEIGAGEKRAICCRQAFLKWQEQLLHKKGWEMFVTPLAITAVHHHHDSQMLVSGDSVPDSVLSALQISFWWPLTTLRGQVAGTWSSTHYSVSISPLMAELNFV